MIRASGEKEHWQQYDQSEGRQRHVMFHDTPLVDYLVKGLELEMYFLQSAVTTLAVNQLLPYVECRQKLMQILIEEAHDVE
jgi:hypothetical protein